MTVEAAQALLDRVSTDEVLAKELAGTGSDPEAMIAAARAAGFDVSVDELREASLDRYGATLTAEQLDSLAAGNDTDFTSWFVIIIAWGSSSEG